MSLELAWPTSRSPSSCTGNPYSLLSLKDAGAAKQWQRRHAVVRALKALAALGLYDTVRSKGYNFDSLEYRDIDGCLTEIQDFGGVKKYGYHGLRNRYVLIDELVAALANTGVVAEYGAEFCHVEKDTSKGHMHLWPDLETTLTGMTGITTAVATAQLQPPADYHIPVTIVYPQSAFVTAPQQRDGLEVLIGKK